MPTGINFGTGTLYVSALPTHNPGSDGARRAINTATGEKYRWVSGTTWEVEPGGGLENPVDHIDFVASPATSIAPRRLQWNADAGTLDLGMDAAGVVQQIGEELFFRVKNQTGSTIIDGTLVMSAGTTGNSGRILVTPSINDGSVPGHLLVGIVTHNLANGADGFATHFGQVRGINTTGAGVGETWLDGDLLYPNPTQVGKLTNVLPTGAGLKNPIAIVIHAHSNGSIFVRMSPGHEAQAVVTYAELTARISASTLIPGLQYLISDFRSAWYHLDGGAPINSPQKGAVEPIVVTAISANKIASLAFSTVHPSDVLYYDWDAANWNTDAFYSIGSTIIPGWRGVITERIDTLRNNRATFNFRVMTFRRWGITAPAYDSGTTYNLGDVVESGNFLFLCKQYNTTGIATSNADKWVPLLGGVNINTSKFWATISSGIGFDIPDIDNNDVGYMQIDGDGTFQDYLAFPIDSLNMNIVGDKQASLSAANFVAQDVSLNVTSFGVNCTLGRVSRVVIEPEVSDCYIASTNAGVIVRNGSARIISGIQANMIVTANNFVIGDGCFQVDGQFSYGFLGRDSSAVTAQSWSEFDIAQAVNLTTGAGFSKNRAAIIQDSSFASNCQGNAFNDIVYRCQFGNNCAFNTFNSNVQGVTIKDNFINNTANGPISDSSLGYNCEGNSIDRLVTTQIGDAFVGNTGVFFIDSQVDSGFQNNIFGNMVQYFKGGAGFTGTDYSASTIVYGAFTKTFANADGGGKVVQYIDASNAVVITNHDA